MLYLLTGEIQIGKTTWLERLVAAAQDAGVVPCGVVSPGRWRPKTLKQIEEGFVAPGGGRPDDPYEKLGIDCVLLPQGRRISFATRGDLAGEHGALQATQSTAAALGWTIDDAAIAQVNAHFDELAADAAAPDACCREPRFLVVDELGRLELVRNQGFTSALALLDAGPASGFEHALAVVRADLLSLATERFMAPWEGQVRTLPPDEQAFDHLLATLTSS